MSKKNSIFEGLKDFPRHLNSKTFSAGLIAAIFGCTGPALIIINGAMDAGIELSKAISWIFAVYFFGALVGLILALKYRQPIAGAYSIPGAVLVVEALKNYSLSEAAGAYFIAGIIVFLLGITRIIGKIMSWIPVPIIMAMIAGAMIRFGTEMIALVERVPLISGTAILVYLLSSRITNRIPPILSALIVSGALAVIMKQFEMGELTPSFVIPELVIPTFTLGAIISIAIPLAVLVIGAENAQATGVLMSQGYKPPVNQMTLLSGVGGMITSFFGGHNANIAGPMTAICASKESGEKLEGRYASVVVNALFFGGFGLLAGIAVPFVAAFPGALIATVAGLAMISVLLSSLQAAFSERKFQIGAFFALIIAMSGIKLFGISSPFWALVGGVFVSYIIEKADFDLFRQEHDKGVTT